MLDYTFDDGLTYGHERGERGVVRFRATRAGDAIALRVEVLQSGWKPLRVSVVGYDGANTAVVGLPSGDVAQALTPDRWTFAGQPLPVARGAVVTL